MSSKTVDQINMRYVYMSHVLEKNIPVYGNHKASLRIESIKNRTKGDAANVFKFTMENHWGTHVDTPAHFFDDSPSISEFKPESWLFLHPCIIELKTQEKELIEIEQFKEQANLLDDNTDLLLIRTGFQRWRGTERYCNSKSWNKSRSWFLAS